MSSILSVDGLALGFGGLSVLEDISLDVAAGTITGVIGPNGAGKTALLNCVNGIYRPLSGRIVFEGEDLIGLSPQQIARRGIGRSFQNLELFPSLTVVENLLVARDWQFKGGALEAMLFCGRVRRQELEQREHIEKVIDFFELLPIRQTRAQDLPYGRQKIVGLARAMAMSPKLLLLDEPGSGLTRDEKEDLARFLLRLRHDWGVSILWIEHDLQMVMDLTDRVHVLHLGQRIASGAPAEVRKDPAVESAYFAEGDSPKPASGGSGRPAANAGAGRS